MTSQRAAVAAIRSTRTLPGHANGFLVRTVCAHRTPGTIFLAFLVLTNETGITIVVLETIDALFIGANPAITLFIGLAFFIKKYINYEPRSSCDAERPYAQ